jgi:acyl dehydratase
MKELFYEEIDIGNDIPSFTKTVSLLSLAQYSAATWDFHYAHIDKDFVKSRGFPGIFVDGQEFGALFVSMITRWAGPQVVFKKMGMSYRTFVVSGDTIFCTGRVRDKYQKDGECFVDCELSVQNQKNEKIVSPAYALITVRSAEDRGK